jgi:hypothetical protein
VVVTATPTDPDAYARALPGTIDNGRRAITDAAGRFAIPLLAPATYVVSGKALQSDAVSNDIEITAGSGQRVSGLTLSLNERLPDSPGVCTISGHVSDTFGNPRSGLVTATPIGASPDTATTGGVQVGIDAEGRYCLSGLSPGDYLVSAASSGCGAGTTQEPIGSTGNRRVSLLPTYYPDTVTPNAATVFPVNGKTAVDGIDIVIQPTTAATLTIHVTTGGRATAPALVVLHPNDGVASERTLFQGDDDRVVGLDLTAGRYSIIGSAKTLDSTRDGTTALWATADITSDGDRAIDMPLALEPGARVSGRLIFDGTTDRPKQPQIWLAPLDKPSPQVASLPWAGKLTYEPDGRFVIDGVLPGRYVLQASDQESFLDPKWSLVAATRGREDDLDLPIELGLSSALSDLVLTLTDRIANLSGHILDGADRPVTGVTVVAFSTDARYWWPDSRRVQMVDVDANGAYTIDGLPPGNYTVSVITNPANRKARPDLQSLVPFGLPVSLALGEHRTLDVRQR